MICLRPSRRFVRQRRSNRSPVMIVARTIKGKGISFLEDKDGWHGKALDDDQWKQALRELSGVDRDIRGTITAPEDRRPRRRRAAGGCGQLRHGHTRRDTQSLRRSPEAPARTVSAACQPRRRGEQLDDGGHVCEGGAGALLRNVHRRAEHGGGCARPVAPRKAAVRVDVCRLLHTRVRSDPDEPILGSQHEVRRLARGRLDRRRRSLTNGPRRHRDVSFDSHVDGAASV